MHPPTTSSKQTHPFDRSGFAPVSDFETPEWRELFNQLEMDQSEFLAKESEIRSPEYIWAHDPLHTWSRVWEYPYAYHHLKQARSQSQAAASPCVVDLGSGVTFFPFSIARLGYRVTCVDVDPICAKDIPRAAGMIPHAPGSVDFRMAESGVLPFQDNEVDAVYCISVLEHIPNPEKTVSEIARILKPGGLLILTIDLDLRGDSEIGVLPHKHLVAEIEANFAYCFPELTVHPADLLDNTKGPFKHSTPKDLALIWHLLKQQIKPLVGKSPNQVLQYLLAIQAFVMTRKTASNNL